MRSSLNYVWIANKEYYDPRHFASGSPIPVEYLHNAFRIANKNPFVPVLIWCDFGLFTRPEKNFLLNLLGRPINLAFEDLRNIRSYRWSRPAMAYRRTKNTDDLWRCLDLARLLVVRHVLENMDVQAAFYSDFDVANPDTESDAAVRSLRRIGLYFGFDHWFAGKDGEAFGGYVENQFFGVHRHKGLEILDRRFIPAARQAVSRDREDNGWPAFRRCAMSLIGTEDVEKTSSLAVRHIPMRGQTLFDENALVLPPYRPRAEELVPDSFLRRFLSSFRRFSPDRQKILG